MLTPIRKATICVLIVAVVAIGIAASTLIARRKQSATLNVVGTGLSYCSSPPTKSGWLPYVTIDTGFGQDYFGISPSGAAVTVTQVSLVNPTGGLKLVRASFVPNGGVGGGFAWPSTSIPARWMQQGQSALQRPVPTTLTRDEPGVGSTAQSWQLVVDVSLPRTSAGGYAAAVRVTYSSGGKTRHVTGDDGLGMFEQLAGCNAAQHVRS